jgi:hypothetical protein
MTFARTIAVLSGGFALLFAGGVAAKQDSCGPATLVCLPTLDEHGSIADVPVTPPMKVPLATPAKAQASRDLAPTGPYRPQPRVRTLRPYNPHDVALTSALGAQAAALANCRVDVARARRVAAVDLPADEAHVRLWVKRNGRLADWLVSTTGAIGPDFLKCLQQQVSEWSLPPPEGGGDVYVDVNVWIPPKGQPTFRPAATPVS